jgi:hypothetical protein
MSKIISFDDPLPCKPDCLWPACDGTCGHCHGRGYLDINAGMLYASGDGPLETPKAPCSCEIGVAWAKERTQC